MKVTLQNVTKIFPSRSKKQPQDVIAVNDFSFEIPYGQLIGLLGPSGCGKSTTLNLLSGLQKPTSGKIFFGEDDVTTLPPENRGVGLVFQNYALYPHLTVQQNITFPLENRKGKDKLSKQQMADMALEAAKLVQIDALMDRKPSELSGGQQQRVAIARTLAPEPTVLFMDEPLSNLDAKLRLEMRSELQRLHLETGSTFVYVTHDQMEAMTLATRICLIDNGVLQQYDAPLTVYSHPNNLFVADFVGNPAINFVEAKGTQNADGKLELSLFDGKKAEFTFNEPTDIAEWYSKESEAEKAAREAHERRAAQKGYVEKGNKDTVFKYHLALVNDVEDYGDEIKLTDEDFVLGIRPESISISPSGRLEGEIYSSMPTGMETTVRVAVGNYILTGVMFGGVVYKLGEKKNLDFLGDSIILFSRSNGKIIGIGSLKVK